MANASIGIATANKKNNLIITSDNEAQYGKKNSEGKLYLPHIRPYIIYIVERSSMYVSALANL